MQTEFTIVHLYILSDDHFLHILPCICQHGPLIPDLSLPVGLWEFILFTH